MPEATAAGIAAGKRFYAVYLPDDRRGVYLAHWGSLRAAIPGVAGKREPTEAEARAWLLNHGYGTAAAAPRAREKRRKSSAEVALSDWLPAHLAELHASAADDPPGSLFQTCSGPQGSKYYILYIIY